MRVLTMVCWFLITVSWWSAQASKRSTSDSREQESPQLISIRSLLHGQLGTSSRRVVLRGTITYSGDPTVIQDQTGAISVHLDNADFLTLGDEVEVHGDAIVDNESVRVQHAIIQSLWHSSMPAPLALTPDLAAEGAYDLYLVQVEGTLRSRDAIGDYSSQLSLEGGHQFFTVQFADDIGLPKYQPGSVLRVTGVLFVHKIGYGLQSGSFSIFLRSADDVALAHSAPWWTARHVALLSLLLIPLGLSIHFFRLGTVRRRFAIITKERARIARDIHDTLAQGFAGVAFQLEGAKQEIARDHSTATDHLNTALNMIRHSRAEAHRAISTLHAAANDETLEFMIRNLLRQMSLDSRLRVQMQVIGNYRDLDVSICSSLFRIVQEALSNTLQHAQATQVFIELEYGPANVILRVKDDGIGFDPANVAGPESGHFGLTGMMERAKQLRGEIEVCSGVSGTSLTIFVRDLDEKSVVVRPHLFRWRFRHGRPTTPEA